MIHIGFGCDGARPMPGQLCDFVNVPEGISLDDAEEWIDAELQNREWTSSDGKHFCPQHNPKLVGERITVRGSEYTEIAPGVRVRIPSDHPMFELTIEVQREDRECHGHVGAICGGGNGPYGAS